MSIDFEMQCARYDALYVSADAAELFALHAQPPAAWGPPWGPAPSRTATSGTHRFGDGLDGEPTGDETPLGNYATPAANGRPCTRCGTLTTLSSRV